MMMMMNITYISYVISHQLTVQCHKKKTAPCVMERGSATTDYQFAYFIPYGDNLVHEYEWNTEKWKTLPPLSCWDSGLIIIDGALTAVGGSDGSCRCINKLFTFQGYQWVEHYPPMITARSSPAIVSISDGNYVLVIGGWVDHWTTAVELFHVRSRRWYDVTNLPQAVLQPSATVFGNHLGVMGQDGNGYMCSLQALLSSAQPIKLQWTPLPQQPVKWSTIATLCGQLVIVGGQVNSIYQLLDGEWVKISSIYACRLSCLVVNPSPDKMIIVGGDRGRKALSIEECVVV